MNHEPQTNTPRPDELLPAADAFAALEANRLSPEEQLARFLLWLKVHDGGHQPC